MSKEQNIPQPPFEEEDSIDLIAFAKTIWNARRIVIKTTLIFMVIGLFIGIFSGKEFTASTTIIPQTKGSLKVGGSLSGLAAMAGINLGSLSKGSGISPMLYPEIINSIPFQKELLQTPLNVKGQDNPVTYTKYFTDVYNPNLLGYIVKYTIGLPGVILKALKPKAAASNGLKDNKQILSITSDEKGLIKNLKNQISLDINKIDGYVTITAKMPEAVAAAQLAERTQQLLQQYIIKFKIQKSKEQLKFIQERYKAKEKEFKKIQQQLATFTDRNQNVTTAMAQTKLQSLQSEYDLAYGVYAELAKQLETQQIQVKEDTPVFTILKPVSIPIERTSPKRKIILLIWMFLGILAGIGIIFGKAYLTKLKDDWKAAD